MRKLILLVAILAVLVLPTASAQAAGDVEYTWSLAALGQGGWVGGPLYEDGSAGGVARSLPITDRSSPVSKRSRGRKMPTKISRSALAPPLSRGRQMHCHRSSAHHPHR